MSHKEEKVAFIDWDKMSTGQVIGIGEQLLNERKWQEAEQFLIKGLEKAKQDNNPELQCMAYGTLGRLYRDSGNFPEAMDLYKQGLSLAEQIGHQRFQGIFFDQMGSTYFMQDDWKRALAYYEKSLQDGFYGDEADLAVGYGNLGNIYSNQGAFEQAIQSYKKSLDYSIKIGADHLTANQYGNLGLVYAEQGRYDLAIEMYQKDLEIAIRIRNPQGAALVIAKEKFPEFVHGIFEYVYRMTSAYYLEIDKN